MVSTPRRRWTRTIVMAALCAAIAITGHTVTARTTSTVQGTVTDGSGHGWPLYAKLTFTGDGSTHTVYSNPSTGAYSAELTDGVNYGVQVDAVAPGYLPLLATTTPVAPGPTVLDLAVLVDDSSCSAPGYASPYAYSDNFEQSDGGLVGDEGSPYAWVTPTNGPGSAHSGSKAWGMPNGYGNNQDTYLTSPAIDLSARAGEVPVITWWNWLHAEDLWDWAALEVSRDNGVTWARVWGRSMGAFNLQWTRQTARLDPSYAVAGFRYRFHMHSDWSVVFDGLFIDDVAVFFVPQSSIVFHEDFEADNGGYTVGGANSAWEWGTPVGGPGMAYSGSKAWGTNMAGGYPSYMNSHITSPAVDLAAYSGQSLVVSWWQYLATERDWDWVSLHGSPDDGVNWNLLWGGYSGQYSLRWHRQAVTLAPGYSTAGFRARFLMTSDDGNNPNLCPCNGVFLDDVSVELPTPASLGGCTAVPGGVVRGQVTDANTGVGLVGAVVTIDGDPATAIHTVATPDDPGVPDGVYSLFVPGSGAATLAFTKTFGYQDASAEVEVEADGVVTQDAALAAGRLTVAPTALDIAVPVGGRTSRTFTVTNDGGAPVAYTINEARVSKPAGAAARARALRPRPSRPLPMQKRHYDAPFPPASKSRRPAAPRPYAAGDVVQSWTTADVVYGLAFDGASRTVWLASPGTSWFGTNHLTEYSQAGVATGRSHEFTWMPENGPGDAAFNWNTGMLWVMNVDSNGNNCLYEMDPASGATGNTICPGGATGFAVSQRGLAYDPDSDTWYAGGWTEKVIYHFDASGTILDQVYTGLDIAGLAYNPATHHLFVATTDDTSAFHVLDPARAFQDLGQFTVTGFTAHGGAGLEIGCDGRLWAVDHGADPRRVYQFESGEKTTVCRANLDWVSVSPASGTLEPGGTVDVTLTIDARDVPVGPGALPAGTYAGIIGIGTNTPYGASPVDLALTVAATTSQIKGIVKRVGGVVPGAIVTAWAGDVVHNWTTAGPDGRYVLTTSPGTFTLGVTAPGYFDYSKAGILVGVNKKKLVNPQLSRPGTFQGTVKEMGAGTLLEGVLVQLLKSGVPQATTTTGADGAFSFTTLRPAASGWVLRFTKDGYVAKNMGRGLPDGATVTVNAVIRKAR